MSDKYVIKAVFGDKEVNSYKENPKLSSGDFKKAIAPIAIGAYYIDKEISTSIQISRNYVLSNKISSAKIATSNILAIGSAFAFGGISAGVSLLIGKTLNQIHNNVVIQTQAAQSEIANNNLREQLGLEATNYSRYRGLRR